MIYLTFLFATGLYLGLGPGGPLHNDGWFSKLQRRVDAIRPDFWFGFVLLVVVPCVVIALLYSVLEQLFGAAAMLILGTAALYFSFGRADFNGLIERFLARCDVGDYEGGALVLEQAGAEIEAGDAASFGRKASRTFIYEGFQRWFPAVFYFLLLGPFWAVAYRLIQLSSDDHRVPVGSLRHLADWLPSRLLLLTFAVVGNFETTFSVLRDSALDPNIETDELLLQGAEHALARASDVVRAVDGADAAATSSDAEHSAADADPAAQVRRVQELLKRSMALWVILASIVAILG